MSNKVVSINNSGNDFLRDNDTWSFIVVVIVIIIIIIIIIIAIVIIIKERNNVNSALTE